MKHVTCSCGYVASAESADDLLTAVEAHIAASHGTEARTAAETASSRRKAGLHPRQVRNVTEEAGPGRVAEMVEEDR